jgi:hypothetical protein
MPLTWASTSDTLPAPIANQVASVCLDKSRAARITFGVGTPLRFFRPSGDASAASYRRSAAF